MQFLQVSALCNPLMSRNACNGENGETGEKSPASGDLNWMPKVAPWRLAILAKMAIVAKLAILAKIARNACNGVNGKKLPASGDLNWMPKVRIHCLLYFNLAFFFTNFAIFLKFCDQMRFEVNCAKSPHHATSDGLFLPSKPCSFPNTVNSLYDGHC